MKYVISFLFLSFSSYCQNSFELVIKTKLSDLVYDIIQNDDDSYTLIGSRQDNIKYLSNGFLYKISPQGVILNEVEITKPDTNVFLASISNVDGNNIIVGAVGSRSQGLSRTDFLLMSSDENFHIQFEKEIPLANDYSTIFNYFVKFQNGKIFIAGDANHINQQYSHDLFIYEINTESYNYISEFTLKEGLQFINGFMLLPEDQGLFLFSVGNWGFPVGYSSGYYSKYDQNLNLLVTDSLPGDIHLNNFALNFSNNSYLISGREYVRLNFYGDDELRSVIYKMQYPNIPLGSFEYHMGIDTLSTPAWTQSFDTTPSGDIFFTGTANIIPRDYPFQHDPSWIFLSKLNNDLTNEWTHFFGGDKFYEVVSIKATQDGGAIMACRTYDHLTQGLEHDILIMKVNQNGLIVGNGEELPSITVQDAIVYPNPGIEYLKVQSGSQINNALFELFDINGSLVHTTILNESVQTVNTFDLSPGIYPYRITFDNKIVGSGKWVKE